MDGVIENPSPAELFIPTKTAEYAVSIAHNEKARLDRSGGLWCRWCGRLRCCPLQHPLHLGRVPTGALLGGNAEIIETKRDLRHG